MKRIRTDYFKKYYETHQRTAHGPTFAKLVYQAKKRELELTITVEDYAALRSQPCFYCGGSLPILGNGIDRKDSRFGYVHGNVVPCCSACNTAKGTMSQEEFRAWILRVYSHWQK